MRNNGLRAVARSFAGVAACIVGLQSRADADVAGERDQPGITARLLGVIVNDSDPYSVEVGKYYVASRRIPPDNVVHVKFVPSRPDITAEEFAGIRASVAARIPTRVQAFALTWVQPYRVECMSLTTAFAMGFDRSYCASGCARTRPSPYFNAHTRIPADTLGIFPTMSIAATDIAHAKELIDRGIAADGLQPDGTAYLVRSGDSARDARVQGYRSARDLELGRVKLSFVDLDQMRNRNDVIAYFVGARYVQNIDSNRYLPGAVADHLTSTGGDLLHTRQMSALKWIDAGVTGTYGTVVEPCAFVEKFPDPTVFLRFYLAGETLIEAYWKSVSMPGQGIFVGEPLARPFAKIAVPSAIPAPSKHSLLKRPAHRPALLGRQ